MSNFWKHKVAQESKNKRLEDYTIVAMEEKYDSVYDLMMLPQYDEFFYEGDREEFLAKKASFNKGLSRQYQGTGVVALYKGEPIAFCIGATRKRYLVMATHPDHVGVGLGTLLLELLLRKYMLTAIPTILASTKSNNTSMQSILERYGKRIQTEEENHYLYQLITATNKDLSMYQKVLRDMNAPVKGI